MITTNNKNMPYSTDLSETKDAIESYGFQVRNITNARRFKTKNPMSMSFIDLEHNVNNPDIYNIQCLLNAKLCSIHHLRNSSM